MKTFLRLGALCLALAAVSAPALARDHDWRDGDRGRGDERRGHDRRDDDRRDHWRGNDRRDAYRHDDRRDWRGNGYGNGYYRQSRVVYHNTYYRAPPRVVYRGGYGGGYGGGYYAPRPQWVRGGRYYGNGYGPTYVVNDYGYYGLRPPPRGYGWRRSDAGDFLLVALTTGIIADLVFHH